jgi:hypothetical protein
MPSLKLIVMITVPYDSQTPLSQSDFTVFTQGRQTLEVPGTNSAPLSVDNPHFVLPLLPNMNGLFMDIPDFDWVTRTPVSISIVRANMCRLVWNRIWGLIRGNRESAETIGHEVGVQGITAVHHRVRNTSQPTIIYPHGMLCRHTRPARHSINVRVTFPLYLW